MDARRIIISALVLPWLLGAAASPRPSAGPTPTHTAVPQPTTTPAPSPSPSSLPPAAVLQRYADALASVSPPAALIFDYTVEQAGLRDIEQKHRVYRLKAIERDEMTEIDGRTLHAPAVRVMSGRIDRYDILAIAPRTEHYVLTFVKAQRNDGHFDYLFHTVSRTPEAFLVDAVTIDGQTFLPSVVSFHTVTGATQAAGQLFYARVEGHWLIREASVNAAMSDKQVRERLVWTAYQFPGSLPSSTFTPPNVARLPVPFTELVRPPSSR